MNRQIRYLRDDVKAIIETQAQLQTVVMQMAKRDIPTLAEAGALPDDSNHNDSPALNRLRVDVKPVDTSNVNMSAVDEEVSPNKTR